MKKFILFFALLITSMTFSLNNAQAASLAVQTTVAPPVKKTAPTKDEAQIQQERAEKIMKSLGIKTAGGGKSQLIALILCLLVGIIGIHRFYLGYIWQGVVQLLTAGVFGIWTL
ncbi:MAG: hypothetical protein RI894_683, partial [Bacteroidota bacterium]